ncbi:hypothetical protein B0H14DRAFT_2628658 [Mycena olivaceomarginata]|nr:hypothetical protein B0H14DRAFT_2628658 [Mycena olivaceomarginata]
MLIAPFSQFYGKELEPCAYCSKTPIASPATKEDVPSQPMNIFPPDIHPLAVRVQIDPPRFSAITESASVRNEMKKGGRTYTPSTRVAVRNSLLKNVCARGPPDICPKTRTCFLSNW